MEKKLRLEPAEVVEQARWAVGYANAKADEVEFSCEDATRSDPRFVAKVCREAIEPARRRSTFPTPSATACRRSTRASCSRSSTSAELEEVYSLSVHCHNDLGLAVANSLAAVRRARRRSRRPSTASASDRERSPRGDRHGAPHTPRLLRGRDRHRRRRDRQDVASRREADGLQRPALQGDRGRERVRPRGRHPPGRDAEGREDLPDHGPRPSSGS